MTPIFPRIGYFPVQYLMLMSHRSEIALMAKKSKELYSVMSSVNDIYILRKNLVQRSPHPDYFFAIKITFTYMHLLLDKI